MFYGIISEKNVGRKLCRAIWRIMFTLVHKKLKNKYTNKLGKASSPYLLQHANNPVAWQEWGPDALRQAKEENKPILISIGYSACHWCHVMARESFMDKEVAQLMNENFICIKVDREERPDIDQIYIKAAQLLNGNAGWPLNAFALPDGRPFWAGVYFPKSNWLEILQQLAEVYQNKYHVVEEQAQALTEGVSQENMLNLKVHAQPQFKPADYIGLWEYWKSQIDFDYGGFSGRQKFPMAQGWTFLLQYSQLTHNQEAREAVNQTLQAMAYGGIYDQVGGGFARYATDVQWFAPHFEKMLYDNAQLVSLYAQAYQIDKNPLYAEVVKETLNFIKRELTSKEGAFYSALNAESEGVEGKYYVWTAEEIEDLLEQEQAGIFKAFFNVIPEGNWENGQNILFKTRSEKELAEIIETPLSMVEFKIHAAKAKLLKNRSHREKPSRDDKVLTAWNALMIKAYLDAYKAFKEDWYLQAALMNARFLSDKMLDKEGRLFRNYKDGKASITGFLDDYAYLAEAFVALYQVTFDIAWLEKAKRITDLTLTHFYDEESGMFFYTPNFAETLVARKIQFMDSELPSSNAVMAQVLFDLGTLYQDDNLLEKANRMLMKVKTLLAKVAPYFGKWAQVLARVSFPPYEVAIVGNKEEAVQKAQTIQQDYFPNTLFMGGVEENLPLLEGKLKTDQILIYVCQHKTCQQPTEDPKEARDMMQK